MDRQSTQHASTPSPSTARARRDALLTAFPDGRVLVTEGQLAGYTQTCFPEATTPLAVVRPQDTEEIQKLVRLAPELGVTLYPISGGKNWGYGTACAPTDHQVIVDLSGMNRVLDFDDELGLVTVQPGVTQRDLSDFLTAHGDRYMTPVSGAGPAASILGNALERGYGITPHSDHFGAMTQLHAVLPDGSLYQSALSQLGGEQVDRCFNHGVGPAVEGLFTQSNLGIVTQATFALAPRPTHVEGFFFALKTEQDLEQAVRVVRELTHTLGSHVSSINLMNAHRVLAMAAAYPHDSLNDQGLISDDALTSLAHDHQVRPWMGAGAIYTTPQLAPTIRRTIRKALKPITHRILFATRKKVGTLQKIASAMPGGYARRAGAMLQTLDAALVNFSGYPSEVALPLAYWLKRTPREANRSLDPARDGCGLIWFSPLVPMRPEDVRRYTEGVKRICIEHRIEPLITLTALSPMCFDSTVPLLFDREDAEACARANACYRALLTWGMETGFVPYRLAAAVMGQMVDDQPDAWRWVSQLKRSIDPQNIIAPGRYAPADPTQR